jgi:hypothetical protein
MKQAPVSSIDQRGGKRPNAPFAELVRLLGLRALALGPQGIRTIQA